MNLYRIWDKEYECCCYVFETTRNRAKALGACELDVQYTDVRCETLKKGVNVPTPHVVGQPGDVGYDMVLKLGYSFAEED